MCKLVFLAVLAVCTIAAPKSGYEQFSTAKDCDVHACTLPYCHCSLTEIPGGLEASKIPQLVLLTFDDAVSILNFKYYEEAFFGKTNPDGCPVGTTYFLSHEYTDYSKVHDLWMHGHEIALHSISHQSPTTYWDTLSVEGHMREFADEIDLISEFANISRDSIQGMRIPFLQLSGDNSFEMMQRAGLKYDCTWPTQMYINPGLWPYTLEYKSLQDCAVGACPTSSFPGKWVVPMVDWVDKSGAPCAMVDSCIDMPEEIDSLVEFMKENFNRHYRGNKAPFGFFVHAAWFDKNPDVNFAAYLKFLEYLQSLKDVYLVTIQRALQWVQNPSTLDNLKQSWPSCQPVKANTCQTGQSCRLLKGHEERYMTTCSNSCPAVYPWLNNPLGKAQ